MASDSSSDQPSFKYDVYICFRGEDTRKNFISHLDAALKQAGLLCTFRNAAALQIGVPPGRRLRYGIQESAISLIVFSENFASSEWCLDDVWMITEYCKRSSVVPIFYKVSPSDVLNQTGSFRKAFDAYMLVNVPEQVAAWRDSLSKVANLSGFVINDGDGYEADVIIMIVNKVIKKLDSKALFVAVKLVGINNQFDEINSWLQDPSPDSVVLFIDGMGGIGKSTIARSIFNSSFRNYESSCFLANIHEMSNQHGGLVRLQSLLLSTILKSERQETISNVDEGTAKVTRALSNKKVLLVLDSVTTSKQLDALLGQQMFYPGSKVIITTRDSWLLTAFKVLPKIHSVRTLSTKDATELFSLHAFRQLQPPEAYITQTQHFVRHCMGLPLSLKVLGSSLYGKSIDVWKDTMHKLEEMPYHDYN